MKTTAKVFSSVAIALFLMVFLSCSKNSGKEVILVLDTSYSMAGKGGQNIIGQVKKSIDKYIDELESGTSVTFITFDEDVKVYPSVTVNSKNDRDILKKYISVTEVKGKWTYTLKMIQTVFERAELVQREGRQPLIVVMTDGLDDPPPSNRSKHLLMKDISKKFNDKDWWIFFVDFSTLKSNQKLAFKDELQKVSKNTMILKGDKNPEKAINQDLKAEVKKLDDRRGPGVLMIVLLIVAVAAALGGVYAWRMSQLKVAGRIEYWNNEVVRPVVESHNLTRHRARAVAIGRGMDCTLKIQEFEYKTPFVIAAVRQSGKIVPAVFPGKGWKIEFVNREYDGTLVDGDIFKAGNYTIKYYAS